MRSINHQCRTKSPTRGSLTKRQRKSYIDAVHCLTHKPAQTPLSEIPGVRNRYDDFVGSHLQQTPFVHADGLFLPYHRYYVFLYEKALRDECGYDGAQPYWDWTLSYQDVRQASVFDGSPYSMGSNGEYVPDREPTPLQIPGGPLITFPPATGGGCVYSGPFTPDKFSMHLGPITLGTQGPEGGLGYNPRCLARDLSPVLSQNSRPSNVTALLDGCPDLGCFNSQLDGPTGVHTSGHFQVGSIQFDVFVSPSDPIFWLHHAQMDRIWTIWQNQDPQARTFQVWGTQTSGNREFPSRLGGGILTMGAARSVSLRGIANSELANSPAKRQRHP